MSTLHVADAVLTPEGFSATGLLVGPDGRIEATGDAGGLASDNRVEHPGAVLIPGFVNSHSHSFQVLLRGYSEQARDFRDWVDRFMYPLVEQISQEQIALGAQICFAEMLQAGTTTVGEFYYIHNGLGGEPLGNTYAREAIAAARQLGMRIVLLRTMYDQGVKPGQARFKETVDAAVAHTRELAAEFADDPLVTVAPAPHSLHGASAEMIQAGMALAEELDSPMHIHLAEQQSDLAYSMERYGTTPLRALDELGLVNDRLVLVHGCWLDQEECELLGARGRGLAYNPLTNMALGDGITPLPELLRAGVSVSLGTDANHKLSIPDEVRAAAFLQRVKALEMGVLTSLPPRDGVSALFDMATGAGARNLGVPVGRLTACEWADFLVVDRDHPSLLPAGIDPGQALIDAILFSMVPQTAVRSVFVGGRIVLSEGRSESVNPADLYYRLNDLT